MRLLVGGDVRVDDYIKVVMRHLANITIGRLDCLGVVSVIHRLDAVVELLTRMTAEIGCCPWETIPSQ